MHTSPECLHKLMDTWRSRQTVSATSHKNALKPLLHKPTKTSSTILPSRQMLKLHALLLTTLPQLHASPLEKLKTLPTSGRWQMLLHELVKTSSADLPDAMYCSTPIGIKTYKTTNTDELQTRKRSKEFAHARTTRQTPDLVHSQMFGTKRI